MQNNNGKKLSSGSTVNNMVSSLKRDTCLDKKFSIVMYYIQDSAMSLSAVSTGSVTDTIINILNRAFRPICVSFESCSTVYIPNYNFNKWGRLVVDSTVTTAWSTPKTINLYLPEDIIGEPPPDPSSYASTVTAMQNPTIVPKNNIVIERGISTAVNMALVGSGFFKGSELLHAFGHFFGLRHTFDEINPNLPVSPPPPNNIVSKEFVNRVNAPNCYLHGDGFCDTEADPYPIGAAWGPPPFCYYISGQKDGKGDFYLAPSDNMMSVSACRCRYSQEQYNYMAWFILKYRMYLH